MDNKKIGIFLVIFGLIVLGVIIYFLFFFNFQQDLNVLTNGKLGSNNALETADTNIVGEVINKERVVREIEIVKDENIKPASEEQIKSTQLKQTAQSFAERFGSFSTHSDFSNINDLKIFMTEDMKTWADSFIIDGRASLGDNPAYSGIITKAISSEIKKYDKGVGKAEILVKTQRISQSDAEVEKKVVYEDILITFSLEDGQWKVDSAYWQR